MLTGRNKILVTGADGFIGSHLAEKLVGSGYSVRALCQYNSFGSYGWLEKSAALSEMEVVLGDVRDPVFCMQLLRNCDVVFHLAALIAIPYSYEAVNSYLETNILGTNNILSSASSNGLRHVIVASTSEVYGSAIFAPIDESHPLQAQSPYSASKIGSDAIAMSYWYSFNLPVTLARPFNTFGPRQSARAVIPTIISQIASGNSTIELGDVSTSRDFNYVDDTCAGLISIMENNSCFGEALNIGSGAEVKITELVRKISNLMNKEVVVTQDRKRLRPKKSEVTRLLSDISKIKNLTGYHPKYSLDEGLRDTIAWFSDPENLKRYKSDIYNR